MADRRETRVSPDGTQPRGHQIDAHEPLCTSSALDRVQAVTSRIGALPPAPRVAPERTGTGARSGRTSRPDGRRGEPDGGADPAEPAGQTADDDPTVAQILDALVLLRRLRAELESWEPRLIAAARERGASWAELAPALGVASRQAAERRYLRLRPSDDDAAHLTRDDRVRAERDRRAGDRAVARWARDNGADLRQLAGQITALTDLAPSARADLDRLHEALGDSDPSTLVRLITETARHLRPAHPALAARVDAMTERIDEVRQSTRERRASGRS
jgi:hypothetical protein